MEQKNFKIVLIISVVSAVISCVALVFSLINNKINSYNGSDSGNQSINQEDTLNNTNIAYIDLDTLLLEYKYSIKLNEDLLTEQAKAKASLEVKLKAFEKKYREFSEKARLGSFLSQSSMETQQNELVQEQARLEKMESELTQQLVEKQTSMNKELYDTVMNYVKEHNQDRYVLILGNAAGSSILYAKPSMNITRGIITELNKRYENSQK